MPNLGALVNVLHEFSPLYQWNDRYKILLRYQPFNLTPILGTDYERNFRFLQRFGTETTRHIALKTDPDPI